MGRYIYLLDICFFVFFSIFCGPGFFAYPLFKIFPNNTIKPHTRASLCRGCEIQKSTLLYTKRCGAPRRRPSGTGDRRPKTDADTPIRSSPDESNAAARTAAFAKRSFIARTLGNSVFRIPENQSAFSSFIFAKHSLQYTGLSSLGWNGTLAGPPHLAQVVSKYSLAPFAAFFFAALHSLHLWGSFWNPFSA